MKAIGIEEFGGREKLSELSLPVPVPGPSEILIQIKAAGVNPVDWKIREGLLQKRMPHAFPVVLGWDAAGVVDSVGAGVTRFKAGDEVFAYCRQEVISRGTYAEYIAVPEACAARKPDNLSFSEAAVIPLAGLTAYQALFAAAELTEGEVALIHAAAGGVGGYAVQLAKDAGARVIGTARDRNHDYVRGLGAEFLIDYSQVDFRDAVQMEFSEGIDVVFDCVGGETMRRSRDVLKPGGRLVSILSPDSESDFQGQDFSFHYVFVEPNPQQLTSLAEMAEAGWLRSTLRETFSLDEAAKAHELSESRHFWGKIALQV